MNPEYKGYAFAYKDWLDELKAEYSYNPERAKELLAEARGLVKEADRYGLEKHWTVILFPTYRYNIYQPYLKGYSGELISIVGGVNGASGWMWARLWKENR